MVDKIISLDIETANLSMKDDALDFNNPEGWIISCVGVYDSYQDKKHIYVYDNEVIKKLINDEFESEDKEYLQEMIDNESLDYDIWPINALNSHLNSWILEGYSLLTHNGINFDVPILNKHILDGGASCYSVNWSDTIHYDLSNLLLEKTGIRYRLQHLVKGMLGDEKSKLMDAAFAPVEWDAEKYYSVMDYCISDCELTYEVFTECAKQGEIRAIGDKDYPTILFTEIITL